MNFFEISRNPFPAIDNGRPLTQNITVVKILNPQNLSEIFPEQFKENSSFHTVTAFHK